ncbi:MAG: hypothetical protein ACFB2W_01155 [Leptolyngbyaceae cyanobacterium]
MGSELSLNQTSMQTDMARDSQAFCLEGRFEGFMSGDKSPFKYLKLRDANEQYVIKLSKSVRMMVFRYLQSGDSIRVVGKQSIDDEGERQLKAKEVVRIKPLALVPTAADSAQTVSPQGKLPKAKAGKSPKILICQKSSCRKRGAAQVCRTVETALAEQGLVDTVQVKLTGCMDKCKSGPHMVVMPHKQRYSKVNPKQVPGLVAQNFQQDDVG